MLDKIKSHGPELLFRLVIGYLFVESGWGKFQDLSSVVSYFETLNIPYAQYQAPFVAATELVGGLLIFLGLGTRLVSLPLIGIMVVALITAKSEEITGFSSLIGLTEFLYLTILVYLACKGSRVLSLDSWIKCHGKCHK